jgi:hypothetical protein
LPPAPTRSGLCLLPLGFALAAAFVAGPASAATAQAARPAPGTATAIRAEDVSDRLDHALPPGLYFGATWVDLDGDGDLDLTVPIDSDSSGTLTVWRNDNSAFHDQTAALGLAGIVNARSAAWLDLDLDGDLDLYVTRRSDAPGNLLFENVDGVLRRRPEGTGFDVPATDVSQAWADYDGDGDFDLYLPGIFVSHSHLLRNDGGFRFTDVTVAAGLDTLAPALSAAWADFDDDGDPDLALGEVVSFQVFQNEGSVFREVTPAYNAPRALLVSPSWADVNDDGQLDLFVGGLFPPLLFENRFTPGAAPADFFYDRTLDWGSGPGFGSGGTWADLDLDGDLDLLADGGSIGTRLVENLIGPSQTLLDVTTDAGLPTLRTITWHPSGADFDGDGRVDFFAAQDVDPRLYRNVSVTAGNAVTLALVPARGVVPVGTRVTLDLDGRLQAREVGWPASAFSFPAPRVVLALGARRVAPWVDVRWASGLTERFHGLQAGRLETLVEGRGQPLPGGGKRAGRADLATSRATGEATATDASAADAPLMLRLSCNPCREALGVRLAAGSAPTEPVRVIDLRGRVVRTLTARDGAASWDLRDEGGRRVHPGVYWLRAGMAAGAATEAAPGAGATLPASARTARVVVLP